MLYSQETDLVLVLVLKKMLFTPEKTLYIEIVWYIFQCYFLSCPPLSPLDVDGAQVGVGGGHGHVGTDLRVATWCSVVQYITNSAKYNLFLV